MSEPIDAEAPVLVHQQAHFQWWQRCVGDALEIVLVGELDLAAACCRWKGFAACRRGSSPYWACGRDREFPTGDTRRG